MSLEQKITADIKAAMLAKDAHKLEALRAVKSALMLEKTKGGTSGEIAEADEMKILQKLVKQRKESSEIFRSNERNELADAEDFQAAIIEAYLPKQLEEGEVREIIAGIISTANAQSMKDMGRVMGEASKQLAGKADNKMVAGLVKELLGGN
jgi:uncharacterized protein